MPVYGSNDFKISCNLSGVICIIPLLVIGIWIYGILVIQIAGENLNQRGGQSSEHLLEAIKQTFQQDCDRANKMTVKQVQRYIWLNELVSDLMKLLDDWKGQQREYKSRKRKLSWKSKPKLRANTPKDYGGVAPHHEALEV